MSDSHNLARITCRRRVSDLEEPRSRNCLDTYPHLPRYFEKYGRKEPQTINHVPVTFANGVPEKSFYEMMAQDPEQLSRFFQSMEVVEKAQPTTRIYDFTWLVKKAETEPEQLVFIDVGGGKGHCLAAILNEFPGLPSSRCMLQDRDEVIKLVESLDEPALRETQKRAIDFHSEQPVKGK